MLSIKHSDPSDLHDRDDLSDVGTERAEIETLFDEDFPSYTDDRAGSSTTTPVQLPSEKSSRPTLRPTTSAPLDFPTLDLPSYEGTVDIARPLAIPQVSPDPAAPFLQAYPSQLLNYGIPAESWHAFVSTLSDFVSAKVSKQALHHASDVASTIGDYHKRYANVVKKGAKNIGKEAKRFNPFGVIGGATGHFFGGVGHLVGSIFNVPLSMLQNPKTPRERAIVYITAANKKWFHGRGLHALLLDTSELGSMIGISGQELLGATRSRCGPSGDAVHQMQALNTWLGDIEVRTEQSPAPSASRKIRDDSWIASSSSSSTKSSTTRTNSGSGSGSLTNAGAPTGLAFGETPSNAQIQLKLGFETLWLVVTQQSKVEGLMEDEKNNASQKVYPGT
ncbi:uncharacterized protein CLAFUR5_07508 [Fulvia fulva]|uniref:Uncharacterized protein n=1 Tax=Passalora fulva TaxID=5499 RepID=A0A9Q8PAN4_PASFU|nr:uncharacterized protein CLAFUR5_07508 [Fulvia fulva]KAK4623102.1 hypothetical protein CLAFUR0_07384 [Fulvia fulva]UJO18996.1 hypothetical protein CLAFUR5_07508 [Fulvia fulva]WPV31671.1 hypothetical protein CLAFUW7_07381 [Fulvia fulva]